MSYSTSIRYVAPVVILAWVAAAPALAQTSASYKVTGHAFNAGGHPQDGTVMTSASFRVNLDAIGDAALGDGLIAASYHADGGFVGCFPPPGEVAGLHFTDSATLGWDPERSVGFYNFYRGLVGGLSGLDYGTCRQKNISGESATDNDTPGLGDCYFYLVTAENHLDEEGTKGRHSNGTERANAAACP